jgi:hypothetical protein
MNRLRMTIPPLNLIDENVRNLLRWNWVVWESRLEPRPCGGGTQSHEMDAGGEHSSLYAVALDGYLLLLDHGASYGKQDAAYAHEDDVENLDLDVIVVQGSDCDAVLWGG